MPSWNTVAQYCLVGFTVLGFALTALKMPQYGLISNLVAQVFWLYSSYRAWREADQVGIFVNSVLITAVLVAGIINYWFL